MRVRDEAQDTDIDPWSGGDKKQRLTKGNSAVGLLTFKRHTPKYSLPAVCSLDEV